MTNKTVPVTMPAEAWGRLASRADDAGITVAELIARALQPFTAPRQKRGTEGAKLTQQRLGVIVRRRLDGWTWQQIAAELGISAGAVYELARRNGLTKPRRSA